MAMFGSCHPLSLDIDKTSDKSVFLIGSLFMSSNIEQLAIKRAYKECMAGPLNLPFTLAPSSGRTIASSGRCDPRLLVFEG